jgi:hypothetical protein
MPEGPERPPEPKFGDRPATGKGLVIAGAAVAGAGAIFIVTGLLLTRCDYESNLQCRFGDQRNFLLPSAITVTALGGVLLGAGLGYRARYKKWEAWTPKQAVVVPTFLPGGGGVAAAARF